MPSLFGSRRHAPPVQPLTRETADPNAATAAASAFMRRSSNASLSSAAAAAALRARPMTPTNVADVQSRRGHRRSPSLSSLSSRDKGARRELQRSPSSGSMIDRTFRSPSPGRSPPPRDPDVPPVPSIPDVDRIVADRKVNGGQRKSAALQTLPFKTASEKARGGQQSSWFGGATAGDPSNVRRSDSVLHAAASVPEPRSGSISPSINFSYPRARMRSSSPSADDQALVYDPNSRRMVPQAELVARSQSVRLASEKPRRKKQDVVRTGSHLSRGTVGRTQAPGLATPHRQPAKPEPEAEVAQAPGPAATPEASQAALKTEKKAALEQSKPAQPEQQTMEQGTVAAAEQAVALQIITKPSLAAKEPERRQHEDHDAQPTEHTVQQPALAASPVSPVQSAKSVAKGEQEVSEPSQPRQPDAVLKTRVQSESPTRSAHFAAGTDQLTVKHEPPPRSVSPRKSAMKSSSPSGMSPSDDGSEASGRGFSPQRSEDTGLARKKSARVSWDDRNTVVVGEAVQPPDTEPPSIPSPQAKKPWHNIVTKYAKKDAVNMEVEETMSPRPALPSFGSVREKKAKEPEERPLVRPSERTRSQPVPAPSEPSPEADIGQSSDAAVGAAFMQDQASRNAANISKFREPLPPVVTSVEGSAYDDDDLAESLDDDLDTDITTEPDDVAENMLSKSTEGTMPESSTPAQAAPEEVTQEGQDVPVISVSHPSPHPQEPKDNAIGDERPSLPGGFPEEHFADAAQRLEPGADSVLALDASDTSRSTEPSTLAAPIMDDIEEEEEDRGSVYSDAYEDLGEVDGEGFLSLDAVVESPSSNKVAQKIHETVLAQSNDRSQEISEPTAEARQSPDESKTPKDWENAKAYWKSLTIDQRRQLEMEALSEGGEVTEPHPQPADKQVKQAKVVKQDNANSTSSSVQPLRGERNYQIQPGTKWSDNPSDDAARQASVRTMQPKAPSQNGQKLRSSMRIEEPAPAAQAGLSQSGSMRKSMRSTAPAPSPGQDRAARRSQPPRPEEVSAAASAAGAGMRKSLRAGKANDDTFRQRPVSYIPPQSSESSKLHKRNVSAEPTLQRRGSNDSVSSFTRSRAGSSSGRGFRRSMRAEEPPSPIGARGSGRFSLRSLSPPAFRRNSMTSMPTAAPSFGGARMRQSLRADSVESSPRSHMSPFRRSPGSKKGKKTRAGSRFADSSDEDEGGPSFFSSRFADSSDEDNVPRTQSKGKGIPKSLRSTNKPSVMAAPVGRDTASPDLPDSDDDVVSPNRGAVPTNGQKSTLRHSRSGRGTLMPLTAAGEGEEAQGPGNKRRGSFMSILRRKKDHSNKISRDVGESAARRDTRLERTASELAIIRSSSLHKIGPHWPLPEPEDEDTSATDKTRPSTAHGPEETSARPTALLQRRSTSQGIAGPGRAEEAPPVPDLPPQHKKKKFGALRKMLGIHD